MHSPDTVRVLYFAWLRERVSAAEELVQLAPGVTTVGDLIASLRARSPGHDAALATPTVRCAVNQDFAGPETTVRPGDEVAFFPPVTGG
jgi:sulfur-carrier protein